ncbi:MAG: formate dehydrogenase accessory sulfurtransferase FdhD [Candidatus Thorarchaeota archaeon]
MTTATKEIECIRVKGQSREKTKERIAVESHLSLFVNDEVVSDFIHSTELEEQLVAGYLLSSGLISNLTQIGKIEQKRDEYRVWTTDLVQPTEERAVQLAISHSELLDIGEELTSNQKNHIVTRGFHGAIIWEIPTGRWFMCEDIGRHNAVDKVIGYGAQNGYVLSQSMVLLSGRLVSNIVSKCVNSRIPMLTSMTVATDRGIKLAHDSDMTLVGSLSKDGFWLYNEGLVKIT